MNNLTNTAPEKIYLCVSDDVSSREWAFPDLLFEITWADHQAVPVTVEYVRSDKTIDDDTRKMVLELCAQVIRNSGEYEHIPGTVEAMAADIIERLEAGNGE